MVPPRRPLFAGGPWGMEYPAGVSCPFTEFVRGAAGNPMQEPSGFESVLRSLRGLVVQELKRRDLELRPGAVDTSFAGSTPGAPGKEWFLRPEAVAETLRLALRLPPEARVEELVVRSASQPPEY
jgi:hypothetical protein